MNQPMPRKKTPTPPSSDLHPLPLHEFLPRVRACTLCAPFLPLGPRPALQAGTRARILIASQAPGMGLQAVVTLAGSMRKILKP